MAFLVNENVYINSFTPREYQVELLYAAKERNIIICLDKLSEKTFISTKLIQEFAINNRKAVDDNGKRTIYLFQNENLCDGKLNHIHQTTDLKAVKCINISDFDNEMFQNQAQVLITTIDVMSELLKTNLILADHISLVIIDECHNMIKSDTVKYIIDVIKRGNQQVRIVGFALPLFSLAEEPGQLSYEIERIESAYQCQLETASDILFILRYGSKPKEYIIEYETVEKAICESNSDCNELGKLENLLCEIACDVKIFLEDHRFDPLEIYSEEFYEDIKKIPDPTEKPLEMIQQFLEILKSLGPWCADRVALIYLIIIEKLKIKTPYERHYLLLNVVATMFLKVRAVCDNAMQNFPESEKVFTFSKPKILRLIEILRNFTPKVTNESRNKSDTSDKVKCINDNNINTLEFNNYNNFNDNKANKKHNLTNIKLNKNFKGARFFRQNQRGITDPDLLCGVIFVENIILAKVIFYLLNELSKVDDTLRYLSPLYISEKNVDDAYAKDSESEHKKQEEVLKKFRVHECNLLISTAILEEGIDIPKCNFVMRFNFPKNYQSYVQCKSRARAANSMHILMVAESESKNCLSRMGQFHYVEKILLSKCFDKQLKDWEDTEADSYAHLFPLYQPLNEETAPKVNFNSAIALVNRYCAKLPSDTFTRLAPEWSISSIEVNDEQMYICFLRLPINSPLKYIVASYPMPNKALSKRIAALKLCIQLHKQNELDDYLMPVGKENFKANPEDLEVPAFPDEEHIDFIEARPGTTKRRQYYYKKIAESLTNCRPKVGKSCYLYQLKMVLSCPLPEEQNTRGRRIYPPEESTIGFGILTIKKIPSICPFPIYTRSGEVQVGLNLTKEKIVLTETQIIKIESFLNYTFTNVLRLQKYLMIFDPNSSENSYFIVPVTKGIDTNDIVIDWDFLECIYENKNYVPHIVEEEDRKSFAFEPSKYHDAVIMPWYRNQDQPQYFYVAEICYNLNPKSDFPGEDYNTFEEYYLRKYNIQIQNLKQPLLDVDHTSARLNFLTPRYVNRKGVALPTSSEETKKAKRENLEQKQILIGELCAIHPFPASLWRQAVCLPCVLYRINALLLANQIRCEVAKSIGLGKENLSSDFQWPPLDFGWSLADVINKTKESEKNKKTLSCSGDVMSNTNPEAIEDNVSAGNDGLAKPVDIKNSTENENGGNGVCWEIGTWSNDMIENIDDKDEENLEWNKVRYGSPTYDSAFGDSDVDNSYSDYSNSSDESEDDNRGLKIAYMGDNVAEAVETHSLFLENDKENVDSSKIEEKNHLKWNFQGTYDNDNFEKHSLHHHKSVKDYKSIILKNGLFISATQDVLLKEKAVQNGIQKEVSGVYEEYITTISDYFREEVIVNSNYSSFSKKIEIPDSNCYLKGNTELFSFDYQPDLNGHPGPSPSLILQALTMSNANDGINLERLETIGDSFLKYAITTYLYSTYDRIHEGKLSHLRSKQVSNLNLYRLGKSRMLGESMIATKFEPHDNWLPPCYYVPKELEQVLIESGVPSNMWNQAGMPKISDFNKVDDLVRETEQKLGILKNELYQNDGQRSFQNSDQSRPFIPYNLITQHSIPDKSIADCVEALIGAYLIACGPRGALLFMTWLGINVIPKTERLNSTHSLLNIDYTKPISPLLSYVRDPEKELKLMLDGYKKLEEFIGYSFQDKSYLLQAFTHASYQPNKLTDCYQRLEFLGDAVLDYLITRHLYEDSRQHSPGALTDLRSALVNNTIFASLAVRCGFHKYFRHLSPGLNSVIDRFVRIQEENGHSISEEYYFIGEQECDEAEDVEVPKALGDVFESLAGAIYLDSNMSLDAVWSVYYKIMKSEIEQFSSNVPKSPIRELLELEPETAKFGKPEKLADGRRVRVTVDVFGKGSFKGIGRNYRIAKCTAAKCALKKLKKMQGHHHHHHHFYNHYY